VVAYSCASGIIRLNSGILCEIRNIVEAVDRPREGSLAVKKNSLPSELKTAFRSSIPDDTNPGANDSGVMPGGSCPRLVRVLP
jgi:hypothetical protein